MPESKPSDTRADQDVTVLAERQHVEMPYSLEAEMSVLSCVLHSPERMNDILVEAEDDWFYLKQNQCLFLTIKRMVGEGIAVDPVSINDYIRNHPEESGLSWMSEARVMDYLLELGNMYLPLLVLDRHMDILRRDARRRRLIMAGSSIMDIAASEQEGDSLDDSVERVFFDALSGRHEGATASLGDVLSDTYGGIEQLRGHEGPVGIMTGLDALDELTGGFRPGQLVVIGARPSVGKTTFAMQLALNAANCAVPVAFFSLEMSSVELGQRVLASQTRIPLQRIRRAELSEDEAGRLREAARVLGHLPMTVDATADTTVLDIRAKTRRIMREQAGGIVFVDYLQLIAASQASGRTYDNRAAQVADMSRGLKMMAKDLDITVVALSQLNRGVESRSARRPQLSDLRDSGAIEQDADIVILLDRNTNPDGSGESRPAEGTADVILAKNRSGAIGAHGVRFDGATSRFEF